MKTFSLGLRRWLPVALWVGIVIYTSTSVGSVETTTKIARPLFLWFLPWLSEADARTLNIVVRKTMHVVQFLVFAFLIWRAVRLPPAWKVSCRRLCFAIVGASVMLGGLSEGIQVFYVERGASLGDVGLDVLGAVLGAAIIWLAERRQRPSAG